MKVGWKCRVGMVIGGPVLGLRQESLMNVHCSNPCVTTISCFNSIVSSTCIVANVENPFC